MQFQACYLRVCRKRSEQLPLLLDIDAYKASRWWMSVHTESKFTNSSSVDAQHIILKEIISTSGEL